MIDDQVGEECVEPGGLQSRPSAVGTWQDGENGGRHAAGSLPSVIRANDHRNVAADITSGLSHKYHLEVLL